MTSLNRVIKFTSSRAYPSVPTISGEVPSHTLALQAIKEALEIHERRTKNILDSFVRVQELVDIGIIDINGNTVQASPIEEDGSVGPHDQAISTITGLTAVLVALQSVDAGFDIRITDLETEALATFAIRTDEVPASNLIYIGKADPGATPASAVWQVSRVTFPTAGEDDSETEWADGNSDFDNVWNNRAALSYS